VKQVRPQRRLLGGESTVEGDCISPLESHWQPLEQVCCFPGVFSDGCHSSAQLLHQFHCLVVPGPSCFYGNWNKDVAIGQLPIIGFLVRSGFVSCHPCRGRCVSEVWVGIGVCYYYYYLLLFTLQLAEAAPASPSASPEELKELTADQDQGTAEWVCGSVSVNTVKCCMIESESAAGTLVTISCLGRRSTDLDDTLSIIGFCQWQHYRISNQQRSMIKHTETNGYNIETSSYTARWSLRHAVLTDNYRLSQNEAFLLAKCIQRRVERAADHFGLGLM